MLTQHTSVYTGHVQALNGHRGPRRSSWTALLAGTSAPNAPRGSSSGRLPLPLATGRVALLPPTADARACSGAHHHEALDATSVA